MACSICGQTGHNAKTCSQSALTDSNTGNQDNNYAVWMRYGGMNKQQAKEFQRRAEDLLDEVAPDSYGVSAAAKESELPERIRKAMNANNEYDRKEFDS
jgi:hypothetical protein